MKKRNPIFLLIHLAACCTAVIFATFQATEAAGQDNVRAKPQFTISRETTFFTEPIRADGSIDFVEAINQRFGEDVKPEENACIYLHRAFGPIKELPSSFYAKLRIERPPAQGQHLQPFPLPLKIAELPAERLEKVLEDAEGAVSHPWTRQQCPELGAWLDAHREPLELVHAAARCQKFYSPLSDEFIFINAEQTKGPAPLLAVLLPGASKLRMAARMLCSRAMLQLGERNAEEAWHDLIACRRLGRLTSVGPTLVETGVGYSVENMGSRGMLTLLQQTHPSSVTVKQYRSGLKKLPPLRSIPDIVNVSERCTYIDALLTIASGQSDAMELLGMEPDVGKAAHMFRSVPIRAFDWNEALKKGNAHYDRMVSAMRLPTHALRRAAIAKLESDLQQRATLRNFDPRGKRGIETSQAFAAVIAAIMLPSAAKVREGEDVLRQTASNVEVAIALCEFRNDRDRYAEQLEQLVPKYLGKMPVDQFTGGKQRGQAWTSKLICNQFASPRFVPVPNSSVFGSAEYFDHTGYKIACPQYPSPIPFSLCTAWFGFLRR